MARGGSRNIAKKIQREAEDSDHAYSPKVKARKQAIAIARNQGKKNYKGGL